LEFATLALFHETLLRLVRKGHDFTDRQKCVLFAVKDEPQTVRGMAAHLNISKPAITRATNRLVAEGLVQRKDDPADRRSVLVKITKTGSRLIAVIEKDAD
jgi:DNA-binding MarR family transcriptional regulator